MAKTYNTSSLHSNIHASRSNALNCQDGAAIKSLRALFAGGSREMPHDASAAMGVFLTVDQKST
jgi:hypothetical protein